jgi:hypothetical protein
VDDEAENFEALIGRFEASGELKHVERQSLMLLNSQIQNEKADRDRKQQVLSALRPKGNNDQLLISYIVESIVQEHLLLRQSAAENTL